MVIRILTMILGILVGVMTSLPVQAGVTATVDRTTLQLGETVELTISSDGGTIQEPELAQLKPDFTVVGSSSSSRVSIINGQVENQALLALTLQPKRAGELTIPALTTPGGVTEPIRLTVTPTGSASGPDNDIFIQAAVDERTPYVQSQVLLTVRLYTALPLREGEITPPQSPGFIIEQLGKGQEFDASLKGRDYKVYERSYALFPQQSGTLELPGMIFRGKAVTGSRGTSQQDRMRNQLRDPLGVFDDPFGGLWSTTRAVQVVSQPLELEVRPRPANSGTGWWLPTTGLTLEEEWPTAGVTLQAGASLTRQVVIHARGLTAEQLPDLTVAEQPGLKVYPDQPENSTAKEAGGVVGTKRIKLAVVPSQGGEYTLPPLEIAWWDLTTGQPQVATLPARRITVSGAPAPTPAPTPAPAAPIPRDAAPAPAVESPTPAVESPTPAVESPTPAPDPAAQPEPAPAASLPQAAPVATSTWRWISLGLLAGWLGSGVGAWWWLRRRSSSPAAPRSPAIAAPRRSPPKLDAIQAACLGNDPGLTRERLLAWGSQLWPRDPPLSLGGIAQRHPELTPLLTELDRRFYGASATTSWNGAEFWSQLAPRLRECGASATPRQEKIGLPPLNPGSG